MHVFFILAELVLIGGPHVIHAIPQLLAAGMFYTGLIGLICYPAFLGWKNRATIVERAQRLETATLLLIGIAGIWSFMTLSLGAAAWTIWSGRGFAIGASTIAGNRPDDGPLQWFYNLTLTGGPPARSNVFSLRFFGANISQREVRLRSAVLISALKGTELTLDVVAESEAVPVDSINLIPPGSPIELLGKFNPPTGLSAQDFLATWSRFNLVVADDTKEYRLKFNEGNIAVFFPGMVGPHVTKKPPSGKQ